MLADWSRTSRHVGTETHNAADVWLDRVDAAATAGDRHLESVLALQTAHLRSAWVEGEEDGSRFLPKWSESSGPANAVEMELMQFGSAYRF